MSVMNKNSSFCIRFIVARTFHTSWQNKLQNFWASGKFPQWLHLPPPFLTNSTIFCTLITPARVASTSQTFLLIFTLKQMKVSHPPSPVIKKTCVHTCSNIWMVPACSSSSSSWSFTLASMSRSCFFIWIHTQHDEEEVSHQKNRKQVYWQTQQQTLACDASSLDSWELRSCSSASNWSTFRLTAHNSVALSYNTHGSSQNMVGNWKAT